MDECNFTVYDSTSLPKGTFFHDLWKKYNSDFERYDSIVEGILEKEFGTPTIYVPFEKKSLKSRQLVH